MDQYLPSPQNDLRGRLSREMTGVEIVNLLIQQTGTYNQMFARPYETNVKANELDSINQKISQINSPKVASCLLSDVACNILRPAIRPTGEIHISNGWDNPREKFIMIAKVFYTSGSVEFFYLQGYTDRIGIIDTISNVTTNTQAIDSELIFIINSINRISVTEEYVNGNKITNSRIVGSNQVICKDMFSQDTWGLRPVDVFNSIGSNYIVDDLEFYGEKVSKFDTRANLNINGPSLSRRANCIPSNYLSSVITEYLTSASKSGYHQQKEDVLDRATAGLNEEVLSSNPVLQYMSKTLGLRLANWFKFKDLEMAFPYINNVIDYVKMTNNEYSSCHTSGMTERHDVMTREGIASAIIAQSVPAIMNSCMINKITFRATNRDITGQPLIIIVDFKTLNPVTGVQSMEIFKDRFEKEIYKSLTYSYSDIVDLDVTCNLYGDTWITISINGGPATPFVYPTFCDGLLSPVMTSNNEHLNQVSAEMEILVNHCNETYYSSHGGRKGRDVILGKF